MYWKYLVVSVFGAQATAIVLRLFCSQLVTDRLDPYVARVTRNETSQVLAHSSNIC